MWTLRGSGPGGDDCELWSIAMKGLDYWPREEGRMSVLPAWLLTAPECCHPTWEVGDDGFVRVLVVTGVCDGQWTHSWHVTVLFTPRFGAKASAQCQAFTTKDTKALQSRPWLISCFASDCLDHTLGTSPALGNNALVCCLHREWKASWCSNHWFERRLGWTSSHGTGSVQELRYLLFPCASEHCGT